MSERREEALKYGCSYLCFFFFFNWLWFLINFRFVDFRMIRISTLLVFRICGFPHFHFTCKPYLTLKKQLNGRFSEVVALKSQFSYPKWNLLGWYSDSWANFYLWTVVLPNYSARNVTQFQASDWVSTGFKYGRIPAVSKAHLLESQASQGLEYGSICESVPVMH